MVGRVTVLPQRLPMVRRVLRQLIFLLATLLIVSFAIFVLVDLAPGGVARMLLGHFATDEQVELLSRELGLNRPLIVRYLEHMGRMLGGDLGYSIAFNRPVAEILGERLWNTLKLAMISFALLVPISIFVGVLAGMREGSLLDRAMFLLSLIMASVPQFAMGVFLATIFAVQLGWFPGTAPMVPSSQWSVTEQYVLPVVTIVVYDVGYIASMVRASMVDVMRQPHIRTAVLKGMSFPQVIWRHALRNALIAPVTIILLQLTWLISGVVVVEALFAYPGFGRMMLSAATSKDYALLSAGTLVAVFVAVMTQFASDVAYALIDPRMRASDQ
jgi:peptide/nickel transport system permease protein